MLDIFKTYNKSELYHKDIQYTQGFLHEKHSGLTSEIADEFREISPALEFFTTCLYTYSFV